MSEKNSLALLWAGLGIICAAIKFTLKKKNTHTRMYNSQLLYNCVESQISNLITVLWYLEQLHSDAGEHKL